MHICKWIRGVARSTVLVAAFCSPALSRALAADNRSAVDNQQAVASADAAKPPTAARSKPAAANRSGAATAEDDPRLDLAEQARKVIESRERAFARSQEELFKVLDEAIAKMPSEDLTQEQLAITALREIAAILRKAADEIVAKRDEYLAAARALQKAKRASAPIFRQAEQAYRDYAAAENYQTISDDYLLLADTFAAFADRLEQQATEEAPDEEAWSKTLDYIARTAIFLQRLERTLSLLEPLDSAAQRAKYSEQLRSYIEYYEKLRDALKALHASFTSQAVATDLRPAPAPQKLRTPVRLASQSKPVPTSLTTSVSRPQQATESMHFATVSAFPGREGKITLPWRFRLRIGQQLPLYDHDRKLCGTVRIRENPYGVDFYYIASVSGSRIQPGYRIGVPDSLARASQVAMAWPNR